ncbi:SMP-30/gluconolactonase/LRE family protein [Marinomonas sp. 15G1-11]|uniref:SMP-30/gluconolactonase/LRE family protein n=1 Tax=Marinomonas phaeophyticola TaxID=3004091 RepID=A0ABT4JTB3_9GAMM|nr:SMP-30/gluconolactonase/LRE family protein [Marinomonas sp. 15G1-11]MCZ2720839.1 SMP-30/gluconolactonase/LRE family protein [Marinomonas sp. 15G1-11]
MFRLDRIRFLGEDLNRPECVLTTSNGRIYCSDWNGGVAIIEKNGHQFSILATDCSFDLKPNGISLLDNGDFLIAHLGNEDGGVYRLSSNGQLTPFLTEINGEPLPPTNYVHLDFQGRIWITVSTRTKPRAEAYRSTIQDGFIILVDQGKARIVADHLGYTNECIVSPDGKYLYVNETFSRRLTRFTVAENGDLNDKTTITTFGKGIYPDGLVFDQEGAFWITSIVSNQVIRVAADGQSQETMLIDVDEDHLTWVEEAFQNHSMGRPHLDNVKSQVLKNISSLAFGGDDHKTLYLGCLLGHQVATLTQDCAGLAPSHWNFTGPSEPKLSIGE